LAKALDLAMDSSTSLTATLTLHGEIAGTPAYMSPEQAAGRNDLVDTRSDVYQLGAILFKLLTGDYPYDGTGGNAELLRRITSEEPRRPRSLKPSLDAELEAIVMKCVAREPEDRYDSVFAFHLDLTRWLRGEPTSVQPPDPFGLRTARRGFPFAADVERSLPWAMSFGGVVAMAYAVWRLNESASALVASLRLLAMLLCYTLVLFPMCLRGVREALRFTGELQPKDVRLRTFAAFIPSLVLGGSLWMLGGGAPAHAVLGLLAGFLITLCALFPVFHVRPRNLLVWALCAAAPVVLGATACGIALYWANAGTRAALEAAHQERLFPASPIGPGMEWFARPNSPRGAGS
jgi:hypothetical protein